MAYNVPTAADLKAFYPAFADVADATIIAHIGRGATQGADTSWLEADYAPAILAFAAHNMALLGLAAEDETAKFARAGINKIRSESLEAGFTDAAVGRANGGTFAATVYGREYLVMLKRNRGGPRVVSAAPAGDGWGATGQLNDGGIVPWAF